MLTQKAGTECLRKKLEKLPAAIKFHLFLYRFIITSSQSRVSLPLYSYFLSIVLHKKYGRRSHEGRNEGGYGWSPQHHSRTLSGLLRGRKAASVRPTATTKDDVNLVASKFEGGVQRPCSEIDDWAFAGGEEEMLVGAAEPMPRVVFGGAPTFQEAQEATSELASALEEAYLLPSNSVGCEDSVSNSEAIENKACIASDVAVAPALPAPAISTIRFLQKSPVAQNIVTSIACDPNVWNSVLQNQELQKFLQSQKTSFEGSDMNLNMELAADSDQSFSKSIDDSSSFSEPEPDGGFNDTLKKIKSAVVDMMSSLSAYFQNFFGGKGTDNLFEYFQNFFGGNGTNGVSVNSDGTAKLNADSFMGASIIGLAIMVIVVILLKRAYLPFALALATGHR